MLILALMIIRFIVRIRTARPADATTCYPPLIGSGMPTGPAQVASTPNVRAFEAVVSEVAVAAFAGDKDPTAADRRFKR
jgi:hypothetical protein